MNIYIYTKIFFANANSVMLYDGEEKATNILCMLGIDISA